MERTQSRVGPAWTTGMLVIGLACIAAPAMTQPAEWGPMSPSMEDVPYPHPVSYLSFKMYGQEVRMAYMDVAPANEAVIELADRPFMSREETAKYTDPLPDGTARSFSFVMDAKSIIA